MSGQYDFGARQYDPASAAFTSLDTVMGSAQNPLSLNRYLYAQADPEALIDRDGHSADDYTGQTNLERGVDGAKAAVASAKIAMAAAATSLAWAGASVSAAAARLGQACPTTTCHNQNERNEWRQPLLDAYAAARAARDAAKARYDSAVSAYAQALQALAAAQASVRNRGAKPKVSTPVRTPPKGSRSGGQIRPPSDQKTVCGGGYCVPLKEPAYGPPFDTRPLLYGISTAAGAAALALAVSGAGESATGIGLVVGIPSEAAAATLEVVSLMAGFAATEQDCNDGKTAECVAGRLGVLSGTAGLGSTLGHMTGAVGDVAHVVIDVQANLVSGALGLAGLLAAALGGH